MKECKQLLTDSDGYSSRCTQQFGTEHSHHDMTAREASRAALAECVEASHDFDDAGGGVLVCDVCHIVREVTR